MTVQEIVDVLDAEIISNGIDPDMVIETACGADLMSDVLAFTHAGSLILTGLTTVQVIYTAVMADSYLVCFVRGKMPPDETIRLAQRKKVHLLKTDLPMFEACGRLYERGLQSKAAIGKRRDRELT